MSIEKINLFIKNAQNYQKNDDYFRAYYNYKRAFRLTKDIKILFIMIDLIFYSQKSGLLVNQELKFKLLKNLINFAFKINLDHRFLNQLYFYKLKLFREFNKLDKFEEFIESNNLLSSKNFLIQQEVIHYLLEIKNYDEAEKKLNNLTFDKVEIYYLLKAFFIDKKTYSQILNTEKIKLNTKTSRCSLT